MVKKVFIGFFCASVIFLIVGIVVSSIHKKSDNYFVSVKEAYTITYDDEAIIKIPLYFKKENKFTDLNNITDVSLMNSSIKINCDLQDVIDIGKKKFNDDELYGRVYEILIPSNSTTIIKNANLSITSKSETISASIGSVSLRYYEDLGESKDITINQASVLAKSGTIEGVLLTIESKEKALIKDFVVDDASVYVDLNNICEAKKEYAETDSIKDVISNYNIYTKQPNFVLDELEIEGEINLILPLKYVENVILLNMPIIIEYEVNGISDYYVLDDFQYVNHLYNIIDLGGVEICQL